jgi:hypothetical protein
LIAGLRFSRCLTSGLIALSSCAALPDFAQAQEKRGEKQDEEKSLTVNPKDLYGVKFSGGLRYDSEGAGTPNTLSGYFFLPLAVDQKGALLFVDGFGSWLYGSGQGDNNFGGSSRLGYRWLDKQKKWMFGLNGGVDTTPYNNSYYWQAGVGAEAISQKFEARINGYIPFGDTSEVVASGINSAYLANNNLYLNAYEKTNTSFGSAEIEVGIPIASWKGGSLWGYSGYYYLDAAVSDGPASSGYKGRAEVRLGTNFKFGTALSYDDIFDAKVLGYVSLGSRPVGFSSKAAVDTAEAQFLANRALPVSRERDVRITQVTINKPNTIATNTATDNPWTIRCVGVTNNGSACSYSDLIAAANAGSSDVILLANGTSSNLNGNQVNLPAQLTLSSTSTAPTLSTQYGAVSLRNYFGSSSSSQAPAVSNGILGIGSNTTISGLAFTDTTITNYSTANVVISANTFTRSYSPNPTGINSNAQSPIDFNGVSNATIANNTFSDPDIKSYTGTDNVTTYLSGRAISLSNSNGITIANNIISGALGEGIGLDNATGSVLITGNTISGMKAGPDSNLDAGIFIRNNLGTATINIEGNTIKDNTALRLKADGTPDTSNDGQNSTDGIELNVCRGSSYAAKERFSDGLYGTCTSQAIITATIKNNTVSNLLGGGDGMGMYVGDSGTLNIAASGNTITGAGDEALSIDMRGNGITNVNIASNILQTANTKWKRGSQSTANSITDGIAMTFGDDTTTTGLAGSGTSSFTITDNTIGITNPTAGTDPTGIDIRLFGDAAQTAPINLTFNIIGNAITSPNGDVIKFSTPLSGGYTNLGNTMTANIWNNVLNKTGSASDYDGFKFDSQTGTTLTSNLRVKNNTFNINGNSTTTTYAAEITQSGGGTLFTLFAGNSSLVNTTSNRTIRLTEGASGTVVNAGDKAQVEANNPGMLFDPSPGVLLIPEAP